MAAVGHLHLKIFALQIALNCLIVQKEQIVYALTCIINQMLLHTDNTVETEFNYHTRKVD